MEGFVVSAPQQSIQSGRKDNKTKKSIPEGCFSEKDGTQGHYNICKFDLCKFKQYIWGKHGSIEITQSEAQRENKWEKQEQSLETCEKITNRLPYLSVIEYQKEKRVKMGQNKYLKRMFLIDKMLVITAGRLFNFLIYLYGEFSDVLNHIIITLFKRGTRYDSSILITPDFDILIKTKF